MPSVHTLSRLRLRLECGWPLCLVASDEMLQQYNAVLVLLMQVGRVGLVLWIRIFEWAKEMPVQPEACMDVGVVSSAHLHLAKSPRSVLDLPTVAHHSTSPSPGAGPLGEEVMDTLQHPRFAPR